MKQVIKGECLCGGVSYTLSAQPQLTGTCYCIDCRKSSGTSHCTHSMVPAETLLVEGELTFYDKKADSGNVVSRGFCSTCGSPVYSTNSGMPGMAFVRASSLDDLDVVSPSMTVYASRAPGWASIDTDNPVFPEMPDGGPDAAIEATKTGG